MAEHKIGKVVWSEDMLKDELYEIAKHDLGLAVTKRMSKPALVTALKKAQKKHDREINEKAEKKPATKARKKAPAKAPAKTPAPAPPTPPAKPARSRPRVPSPKRLSRAARLRSKVSGKRRRKA